MENKMETTIIYWGYMSIGQNSLHPVMDAGMGGVAS